MLEQIRAQECSRYLEFVLLGVRLHCQSTTVWEFVVRCFQILGESCETRKTFGFFGNSLWPSGKSASGDVVILQQGVSGRRSVDCLNECCRENNMVAAARWDRLEIMKRTLLGSNSCTWKFGRLRIGSNAVDLFDWEKGCSVV